MPLIPGCGGLVGAYSGRLLPSLGDTGFTGNPQLEVRGNTGFDGGPSHTGFTGHTQPETGYGGLPKHRYPGDAGRACPLGCGCHTGFTGRQGHEGNGSSFPVGRPFSDKVALTPSHQFDGQKNGGSWRSVTKNYLISRAPEMDHILRMVESEEDTVASMANLSAACAG